MILVAGEALVDLTHDPRLGAGYRPTPGGGPCNTAVALARLGVDTSFLGALSSDSLGTLLRRHLESAGVDISGCPATDSPTTLALATLDEGGAATYSFYLEGTSSTRLLPEDLPAPLSAEVTAVYVGTLGLVLEPTAFSVGELVATAATAERVVVVDPNMRPAAITDPAGHLARLDGVLRYADVVKLSDEDAAAIDPDADPVDTAAELLQIGPSLVVLTRGDAATVARHQSGAAVEVPVPEAEVVDTIGAGDSFGAGLVAWFHHHDHLTKAALTSLTASDLEAAVSFAAAVAAVTVSRPGADPPYRHEV